LKTSSRPNAKPSNKRLNSGKGRPGNLQPSKLLYSAGLWLTWALGVLLGLLGFMWPIGRKLRLWAMRRLAKPD
jgi:hypothetical protein